MMKRCYNEADPHYKSYGGRGVVVFDSWKGNPANFIKWIEENLGAKPSGATLDRINNDGNYEPGNLRWASHSEQMKNRRPGAGLGKKFSPEHKAKIAEKTRQYHARQRELKAQERQAE